MSLTTKLRFEILREIGRGSLGVVYKAVDPNQQKILALREIPREACSATAWERLRKKAQAAIALDSPNIVRTLEVGEAGACFYIVTEYTEGVTLRALLEQKTAFSANDLVDFTRQIGSAIDHAHGRGLVHSNLHPGNCMQEWDGNIKLMDYDLALDVLEQPIPASVPQGLHYLSPEQAEGKSLDLRSNLFSWTAILYEMATGHRAFDGDSVPAVLKRILDPACPELSGDFPALPVAALKKALAKLPELRYPCGDDLVRDLEKWQKPNHGAVTVLAPANQPRAAAVSEGRAVRPAGTATPAPVVAPIPIQPVQEAEIQLPTNGNAAANAADSSRRQPAEAGRPPLPESRSKGPSLESALVVTPAQSAVTLPPTPYVAPTKVEARSTEPAGFLFVPSRSPSAPVPPWERKAEPPKPALSTSMPLPRSVVHSGAIGSIDRRVLIYGIGAALLLLLGVLGGWGLRAQNRLLSSRTEAAVSPTAVTVPAVASEIPANTELEQSESAEPAMDTGLKKHKKLKPVGKTTTQVMTAELAIDSLPAGAQIELDGRSLGYLTPYTIAALSSGEHTVTLTKAGYAVERRSFQLHAAERSQLSVTLVELGATIVVASDPQGGAIFLNGKETGKLTPAAITVRAGSCKVSVAKDGFLAADKTLELAPGQRYEFSVRLTPMGNAGEIKAAGKLKRLFGGASAAGEMVQIRTRPKGAQIAVNQRTLDKVTPAEFTFPDGFYDITLTLNGYQTVHKTIQVGGNGKVVVDVEMQRQ